MIELLSQIPLLGPVLVWVSENNTGLVAIATAVVTLASAIAALTPTPKDDKVVGKLYRVIDWLALNVFKAKDKADDKGEEAPQS